MAMIVNSISNELEIDPNIDVDFEDGIFTLNYFGSYQLFLNKFVPMVNSFINRVINEYHDATMYRYDYKDCFNTMIEDFETVNCPYWKHIVGPFNILFDTSAFEEDENV